MELSGLPNGLTGFYGEQVPKERQVELFNLRLKPIKVWTPAIAGLAAALALIGLKYFPIGNR